MGEIGGVDRVTAIIPVYNGGESFCRCLSALLGSAPAPDEIIVVANGTRDGSDKYARGLSVKVLYIATACGPAAARNYGARQATGDILFFVDADVVVAPNAVAEVRRAFVEEPGLTAVFGSYDDQPWETNFLSQYKNLLHHYVHQQGRVEATTFWAGCGAVRRDTFLALGGFDECYRRPCIEDIELGYRVVRAGGMIRLRKTLQCKHLKRWTVRSLLRADFRDRALPWTRLLLARGKLDNDLNLNARSRISLILAYLAPKLFIGAALAGAYGERGVAAWVGAAGIIAAAVFLGLNAGVYGFFARRRGVWFALRVIPWHWFYFIYGGAAFVLGVLRHLLRRGEGRSAKRGVVAAKSEART